MALQINVDYTSPWNKRYYARDYAEAALEILVRSGYWKEGELTVEHTDLKSPTHFRVVAVRGVQQPGW